MAQRLKRLPGMRETQVQSLGQEDPLEEEMAPHSSTLAWRIPWREEPGRLQSMGSHSRTRLSDFPFTFTSLLVFSICSIISSANSDRFTSSFPIWIPFFFFLFSLLCRTFDAVHQSSGKSGHPILFLILEARLSAFHC